MKLNRTQIVQEALRLLQETGIDGLSTRRLAARLGVESPALYWHFKSKAELLEAMAAAILVENHLQEGPEPGEGWQPWLARNASSFRRALLAYRDGARVHAGSRPDPSQMPVIAMKLGALVDAGFAPPQALRSLIAIGRYTVGCVFEEQSEASDARPTLDAEQIEEILAAHPVLALAAEVFETDDPDANFEHGLRLLLDGMAAELRAASAPPTLPSSAPSPPPAGSRR